MTPWPAWFRKAGNGGTAARGGEAGGDLLALGIDLAGLHGPLGHKVGRVLPLACPVVMSLGFRLVEP